MAGTAAAVTVVVTVGPTLLSGTGDPAQATPSGSGSSLHGGGPAAAAKAEPTAARSRPPFTGERREERVGGKHRAPGPADPSPEQGAALPGAPSGPAAGPTTAPSPTSAPTGGSTPTDGGTADDGGAAGDGGGSGGLHVEVDEDGVVVDSDLTGPVEVPLPSVGL